MVTVNDLEIYRATHDDMDKRHKTVLHAMIELCDNAQFLEQLARIDPPDISQVIYEMVNRRGWELTGNRPAGWKEEYRAKNGYYPSGWRAPTPNKEDYKRNLMRHVKEWADWREEHELRRRENRRLEWQTLKENS